MYYNHIHWINVLIQFMLFFSMYYSQNKFIKFINKIKNKLIIIFVNSLKILLKAQCNNMSALYFIFSDKVIIL